MSLYQNKYRSETTRLKGFNYSSNGYYYITICTKNREFLFGDIKKYEMQLNEYGMIVQKCWFDLPNHYDNLILDEFVIMPDHFHGIMIIDNKIDATLGTGLKPVPKVASKPESKSIPTILTKPIHMVSSKPIPIVSSNLIKKNHGLFEFVRAFKTFSARAINELRHTPGLSVWQSRFYDRIIRNDDELYNVRQYIINNPINWGMNETYFDCI